MAVDVHMMQANKYNIHFEESRENCLYNDVRRYIWFTIQDYIVGQFAWTQED